jgi:hypothetical protein
LVTATSTAATAVTVVLLVTVELPAPAVLVAPAAAADRAVAVETAEAVPVNMGFRRPFIMAVVAVKAAVGRPAVSEARPLPVVPTAMAAMEEMAARAATVLRGALTWDDRATLNLEVTAAAAETAVRPVRPEPEASVVRRVTAAMPVLVVQVAVEVWRAMAATVGPVA